MIIKTIIVIIINITIVVIIIIDDFSTCYSARPIFHSNYIEAWRKVDCGKSRKSIHSNLFF